MTNKKKGNSKRAPKRPRNPIYLDMLELTKPSRIPNKKKDGKTYRHKKKHWWDDGDYDE